jgi:hypothetical protein
MRNIRDRGYQLIGCAPYLYSGTDNNKERFYNVESTMGGIMKKTLLIIIVIMSVLTIFCIPLVLAAGEQVPSNYMERLRTSYTISF